MIRENAVFHDGSAVDAESVKHSLERSLASVDRDLAPGLADIGRLETPSRSELLIRLRKPSTFLLDDLTVPITKVGRDRTVVGTGPYIVTNAPNVEIQMDAFRKHYRGPPSIERILWRAYPTVRTAWAAMMRGEVDFLYEVSQDAREFIQDETSVEVFSFLRNYVYGVIFNSQRDKFRDERLRRALSYAVNRPGIVSQAFNSHARSTSGFAWPEHWAFDATVADHAYDPARASALLDEVGRHSVRNTSGRPPARLHFRCLFPENLPLWERIALLMQRDLAEINVDMELESVPINEFNRRLMAREFDTVLLELIVGNGASRPFTFWHSSSNQNLWDYKSPAIDEALDGIRRARNEAEYRYAFRDFQAEILKDPPAVFLALGETSRAVSKRFQVTAPSRSDIVPTIADWRLENASGIPN